MPTSPTPNPNVGRGIERAVRVGMDLVRTAREAAKASASPPSRERQMLDEHRMAVVRYEAEVRRHHGRLSALRTGAVAGGGGVALFGVTAAAAAAASSASEAVTLGALAVGSALLGLRSGRRAHALAAHPPVPNLPPLPPARLRPGARGADQADRVANALLHLYDLIPSVARLHPPAGQELVGSVSRVEPLLRGQVERLASLDRIEWEMTGSRAAVAAVAAGAEITARLRAGADALEDLIAASVQMLAAPDLTDGVADVMSPAITSLEAFAHGLRAANEARLSNG